MTYKRISDRIVLRLELGEEMISAITELCEKEGLRCGRVTGIGAGSDVTVGVYSMAEKKYYSKNYTGFFEIGSITGNITRKDAKPYLHLHVVFGDPVAGVCVCGHLTRAVIGATAEIIIDVIDADIGRREDARWGLNLLDF